MPIFVDCPLRLSLFVHTPASPLRPKVRCMGSQADSKIPSHAALRLQTLAMYLGQRHHLELVPFEVDTAALRVRSKARISHPSVEEVEDEDGRSATFGSFSPQTLYCRGVTKCAYFTPGHTCNIASFSTRFYTGTQTSVGTWQ